MSEKTIEMAKESLKNFEEKEEHLSDAILTMLKGLSYYQVRRVLMTVKDKAELKSKL